MILPLEVYDEAIKIIRKPTHSQEINEFCDTIGRLVEVLRNSYRHVAQELLEMYASASEHNVDVSRDAVLKIAEQMLSSSKE